MEFDPIDTVMARISAFGVMGLFAVALMERFVPIMPSHGVLLAIGIGVAEGAWSLPAAFIATVTGGVLGSTAWFYAIRSLSSARSTRLVNILGRLFGMKAERIESWTTSLHRNQTALAFSLQLVPTLRLFAPAFAGILRGNARRLLIASAAGIAVWNGLFIGAGFVASESIDSGNTTLIALAAFGTLLATELTAFWLARRIKARCDLAEDASKTS